jgi:hypothetical protein
MAEHEQQTEKEKPNLFWRIVKWIGLGLLTILLIAAFIFRAPWKVITLLVIFLLACTALPKPYRKWFWLSAAVVVIALIVWVFLPDETEGWRPYTFDEELAVLEAKYTIPDSENAALIYNEVFEILDTDANEPNFLFRDSFRQFWKKKDHPETAQWLKEHKDTIEKLMQASKIEKCYFPIGADPMSFSMSIDRLASMRRCAYLLISSANNNIAEGQIDAGLEKYLCVLQMADHIRQQPTVLDMLVGIAIEALALGQFKTFAVTGNATEQHLSVIEEALAKLKYDWTSDFPQFIEYDKLFAKNLVGMFYAVNPKGKVRLNLGVTMRAIMAQLPEDMKNEIVLTYWHRKLTKATTILAWLCMPSAPQKAVRILDDAYEKYYAMAKPDFDWQQEPLEPFSRFTQWNFTQIRFNFNYFAELTAAMAAGTYHGLHDTYLKTIGGKRGCQIIIALRRYKNKHGRWPESLDDVKDLASAEIFVDPINDSSFVYKLTDDNFTLYSKGKNNIDQSGQCSSTWDPNTVQQIVEQDDFLIWPHKKCGTGEENADTE